MLPLGTLSLGLCVIAVDPAFITGHQSIKNCGIWIDQCDGKFFKIPKRDFIFARVKTAQVGT